MQGQAGCKTWCLPPLGSHLPVTTLPPSALSFSVPVVTLSSADKMAVGRGRQL